MSFVFDEKKATNSLGETSWALGNRTDYITNFRASYDAAFSSDRFDSEMHQIRKEYSLLTDHLNKRGFTQFSNPIPDFEDVPLGPEDERDHEIQPSKEENIETFWARIEELKKTNPDLAAELASLGYENQEQFFNTMGLRIQGIHEKAADIADRATGWGTFGNFAGSFSALVTDPLVLASLPIGAMYKVPTTALAAAWKVAWAEGMIALAVEIPIQMKAQGFRKEVGLPTSVNLFGYDVNLGALNAVSVAGGSFLLGGLIQGVVKGTPGAVGKLRKALNKSSDAEIEQISKALKIETPQEMGKFKEPENPFEEGNVTNKLNTENHNAAQSQVLNDVKKEIKPIEASLTKKSLDEIKGNIKTFRPEEIDFDPVNFQYKTDGDARGVSQKLANVQEWDNVAAGGVLVYEFQPKTKFELNDVVNIDANGTKATITKTGIVIAGKKSDDLDNLTKVIVRKADGSEGSITIKKLKEFNKGKKAIVDGHQRLGLAKRLSAEGKKIELLAHTFREVDGVTPEEAMIKGLMVNLMNNTGSAIDAAKVMRSRFGADWSKFSKFLSARSNLVKNAQGLTKLSDDAWGMVINERNLVNLGARVGEIIEDKSLHSNIIKILKGKSFGSIAELEQTLRLTNTLPKTITKQDTLFGTNFFAETLLIERSQLLNWAKKNINKRSAAFKTIIENDTTLQKAGNKLNKLNNEEQRLIYEQVQNRFEQVATQAGSELSAKLTKAAQILKEGKRADAEKLFQQAIDDAAAKGDFRGSNVSESFGANKTEIETQAIPGKFQEDISTNKLFDDPAKGYASEDASLTDVVLGEGTSKAIINDVGSGGSVSTSPAVKSLSITQDLAEGSQRTKATPPSAVFAAATAVPPSFRGDDTIILGSKSSITNNIIYHTTDDLPALKLKAEKNFDGFEALLKRFKDKHKGVEYEISIKHKEKGGELKLDKKIVKEKSPVHISDYLRGRLNVDTIDQARAIAQDIKNTTKTIHFDDFLKTENPRGDGYRAIHLQLITKDGLSVELQVRLKSTKDILTRSHQLRALGKQKSENFKTAKGLAAFEQAQEMVKKELDDAWFRALEKQGAKSDELIDQDIHIGTRIDADGTEVDIVKPLREFLEEDVKAAQALERLKDCK
jgi:hypothetical protein